VQPALASISESECIGCTKCIDACPVDAIVGAQKYMHTVLSAECIGCGLCVAPCPMDCIDMLPVDALSYQSAKTKQRVLARKNRIINKQLLQTQHYHEKKLSDDTLKKQMIQDAVLRAKMRKVTR
jgi:electron transport complex protein RnfB